MGRYDDNVESAHHTHTHAHARARMHACTHAGKRWDGLGWVERDALTLLCAHETEWIEDDELDHHRKGLVRRRAQQPAATLGSH